MQREVGVEFPRGVYGLKGVQRFELFCQLFSLRLSANPRGVTISTGANVTWGSHVRAYLQRIYLSCNLSLIVYKLNQAV